MGVGTKEGNNVTYVKIIQKRETIDAENDGKPYLLCTNGQGEEVGRHTYLNGWFKSIENRTFEWVDGNNTYVIPTYRITLTDGDETFVLECTYSMLAKSLLNSFLSMDQPGKLDISVYSNKKEYPSAWLTNNGEDVRWKYQLDDVPAVVKTPRNNKPDDIDDSEQVAFYEKAITEWIENYKPVEMPKEQVDALNKVTAEQEAQDAVMENNVTEAPDIEEEGNIEGLTMSERQDLRNQEIAKEEGGRSVTAEELESRKKDKEPEVMDDLPF